LAKASDHYYCLSHQADIDHVPAEIIVTKHHKQDDPHSRPELSDGQRSSVLCQKYIIMAMMFTM